MKRFTITKLIVFLGVLSIGMAQTEIRHLPYFLDYNWQNKPLDYNPKQHLKPIQMTEAQLKTPPGPPRIQSASGVELVNISNASSHQSEVFIAVNPHNPNHIMVGCNDYRYMNNYMTAFYSHDGGNTWNQSNLPDNTTLGYLEPTNSRTTVDPGVGYDSEGRPYYIYLHAQLTDENKGDNGVFVARSLDGGKTWPKEEVGAAVVKYQDALQDKCFMAVDSDPKSPYKDRVYAAWFDTKYPFGIGFSYAQNNLSFDQVSTVSGSGGKSVQSPLPVIGPNGVLYLTWEEKIEGGAKTRAVVQKSTDGGASWTWAAPKSAQMVNTSGVIVGSRRAFDTKGDMRISSHPYMDVDLRNGNLYLVQGGKDENGKYGVYMSISKDGGNTWTGNGNKVEKLKKIDGNNIGGDVFLASVAVDPITGMIAVLYYSSQNDPVENKGCDAFVSVSFDEGNTFNHIQLTDTWYFQSQSVVNAGGDNLGRYWGDYTSIDAYNGKIYPCFWMPTDKSASFFSCELFTAKLSTAPNPPMDVTYENLWQKPTEVKLMWKDPTQNMLGGNLNDFKIIVYRDNVKIGEVDKGVQTYTDNGAIEGKSFRYNLSAKLNATGEESVFATVIGIAGGAMEPKLPTEIYPIPSESGILVRWLTPSEHVDSSYLYDLDAIEIYVDGKINKVVNTPQIQTGKINQEMITLETGNFYKIQLKVKTKRGTLTGESPLSKEIIAYAGSPIADFTENFDNSEKLTSMYLEDTWGITDEAFSSSPNCLTDSPKGEYVSNQNSKVIFAPTIVAQGKSVLQFKHIGLINKGDIGSVAVSNDFGNTYKAMAWVDIDRSAGWDKTTYNVNKSEWFEQGIDLSEFIGDTIFVRFDLITNQFTNRDGWYIDDIQIGDYVVGIKDAGYTPKLIDCELVPNPAVHSTSLSFRTPANGKVYIAIYDNLGNLVKVVNDSNMNLGIYNLNINTESMASGFYHVRLSFNGANDVLPLIIQK